MFSLYTPFVNTGVNGEKEGMSMKKKVAVMILFCMVLITAIGIRSFAENGQETENLEKKGTIGMITEVENNNITVTLAEVPEKLEGEEGNMPPAKPEGEESEVPPAKPEGEESEMPSENPEGEEGNMPPAKPEGEEGEVPPAKPEGEGSEMPSEKPEGEKHTPKVRELSFTGETFHITIESDFDIFLDNEEKGSLEDITEGDVISLIYGEDGETVSGIRVHTEKPVPAEEAENQEE